MNFVKFFAAGALLLSACPFTAFADETENPLKDQTPIMTFTTTKGMEAKETSRFFQIYLKSSIANDSAYVDYGNGQPPVKIPIPKANYLTTLKNDVTKVKMEKDTAVVKLYGNNIWFVNINNDRVIDLKIHEGAKKIKEFRCENDSLTDFDFLNEMTSLEYAVITNNRAEKINIVNDSLQRLQMNKQPELKGLSVKSKNLYEFKLQNSLCSSIILTDCPSLRELTCFDNILLKEFKTDSKVLTKFNLYKNPILETVEIPAQPKLGTLQITNNPKMTSINLADYPAVTNLAVFGSGFESIDASDLAELTQFQAQNSPSLKSLNFKGCKKVTSISANGSPLLASVDVSDCEILKTLNLYDCNLSALELNPKALATLTTFKIQNNNFNLETLPPTPTKISVNNYVYAPQKGFPKLPASSNLSTEYDLAGWLKAMKGDTEVKSIVKLVSIFEEDMEEGVDYEQVGTKFRFLKSNIDSLAFIVTNEAYPKFSGDNMLTSGYTRVSAGNSGVDDNLAAADKAIATDGTSVVVKGMKGEICRIYDLTGRMIEEIVIADDLQLIPLPDNAPYIVRAGKLSRKIIL